MIVHTSSLFAFLANAVSQEAASDPWWKWQAQTIVPVAGGTAIAVWSFVANRKSEHRQWERNQRAAHEQWVLDHKREEWRELLRSAAEMQRVLRLETMTNAKRAREIADKLKPAAHELAIVGQSCVFLHDFFSSDEKTQKFYGFLRNADGASESINGLISLHNIPDPESTQLERAGVAERLMQEVGRITTEYLEFCTWLRKEAAISLGVSS